MSRDEEEVLIAAEERARALAACDEDALRRIHHPGLQWTTHTGEVLNREEYIRGNTAGDLVWKRQSLSDVTVTVYGDSAVLVGVVVDEVERDGHRAIFRLRLSQVWTRMDDGGWRCVAGHAGPKVD